MSENEQEKKKTATSNLDIKLWAFGSVLFILMSVFGYLAYLNLHFPLTDRGNYATLGDSFGILSSLFSGLAFAGLIVTIVMQNKTLKAQMEELELARKEYKRQGDELAGQKEVMSAQLAAIQLQQFEATFFRLLDDYRLVKNENISPSEDSRIIFSELINRSPRNSAMKGLFTESNNGHWNLWVRKIESLIRFSYFGYIDKNSESLKTYIDILNDELNQVELFWLQMAISVRSCDTEVFEKSNFFERFNLDSAMSLKSLGKTWSPDYEHAIELILNLVPELVNKDEFISVLGLAKEIINEKIESLNLELTEYQSKYEREAQREEMLIRIAKERFEIDGVDLDSILMSRYSGDAKRAYIDDIEKITTKTQLELQLLISKQNKQILSISVENKGKVLDKSNKLMARLNKYLL